MGWLNKLKDTAADMAEDMTENNADLSAAIEKFTDGDLSQVIMETLRKGIEEAVARLASVDGFLKDESVKIPLPGAVEKFRTMLDAAGQTDKADELLVALNRAAERAVAIASDVFFAALSALSLDDVRGIVTGPTDAATKYLDSSSRTDLLSRFKPMVNQATQDVGAADALRNLDAALDRGEDAGGMVGMAADMLQKQLGLDDFDLDDFVATKALDGLFQKLKETEQKVRADPAAATSNLASEVFSAVNPAI